jgi:hypothetical protein
LAAAEFAFAPRGIIPKTEISLGRAEDFSDEEGTRWSFKNMVSSAPQAKELSPSHSSGSQMNQLIYPNRQYELRHGSSS